MVNGHCPKLPKDTPATALLVPPSPPIPVAMMLPQAQQGASWTLLCVRSALIGQGLRWTSCYIFWFSPMLYLSLRFRALKACWFLLFKYFSFFRSIDLSEALELPGVVDVIRAEDIPGTSGTQNDKLLAVDKVRYRTCLPTWLCADNHQGTTSRWPSVASQPSLSLGARSANSSRFSLPLMPLFRWTYSSGIRK